MDHTVSFEAGTHTYAIDGVPCLSVTEVLKACAIIDDRFFTEYGRHRGSRVHQMIQLEAEGVLDESTVDDRIKGYLDAYRRFVDETGYEALECERIVYSASRRYAGTLDQLGKLPGAKVIVDFKTGALLPPTGLQLTGYASAYQEETGTFVDRLLGIQLNINGRYKIKPYIADFSTWKGALQVAWWKREN